MTQLLVGTGIVLATNIVTFGLLHRQLDCGGPNGRLVHAESYPDYKLPNQTLRAGGAGLAATVPRPQRTLHESGGQSVARLVFLSMWATVTKQRETVFPAESIMAPSMSASGPRNSRTNEVMVIS